MRTLGTWISEVDVAVLQLLEESEMRLPPAAIEANISEESSPTHVGRRCRKLAAAGLLESVESHHGYYRITQLGRDALQGNLSNDEINDLEPEDH